MLESGKEWLTYSLSYFAYEHEFQFMKICVEYANKSFYVWEFSSYKFLKWKWNCAIAFCYHRSKRASKTTTPSGRKQSIHQCKSEYPKTWAGVCLRTFTFKSLRLCPNGSNCTPRDLVSSSQLHDLCRKCSLLTCTHSCSSSIWCCWFIHWSRKWWRDMPLVFLIKFLQQNINVTLYQIEGTVK